jgi:hypothetical protein
MSGAKTRSGFYKSDNIGLSGGGMVMRTQTIGTAIALSLALGATDHASGASAAGVVQRTKERITFEICGRRCLKPVPNGYDGLNWSEVFAVGMHSNSGEGFQSVIRGKVAADLESQGDGVEGSFSVSNGTFSLKSGHFAAATNASEQTTFSAYRRGVLVGTKQVILDPVDTLVKFDKTFSHVDSVVIDGSGDGGNVAMDNLVVGF